ncbi:low choriolytic enzyme-like [Polyodon spathula]|uniref:low choriolytic enzyme-like n=1 Tax=Polyodon spathula TaxID=7913 RepID=UPI001B7EB42D|nr:low choriolytic enzyme-like [Polyodon spathula]
MGRTLVLAMVAVLLPSLSQGNPVQEKYNGFGESQDPESKDIVTRILEANRGNGDKNVIREAVKDFVDQTCIRFIARTTEKQYLSIMPENGCWSYLGRTTMLAQPVSLSAGCMAKGSVQHELFHALGFYHEQSRSDRDQYVNIMWDNIEEAYKNAFAKEDTNNLDTTYDYSSIMHYPSFAFTKNRNPTVLPILNPERYIGQRVGMTATDIKKVNRLYQCGDRDLR